MAALHRFYDVPEEVLSEISKAFIAVTHPSNLDVKSLRLSSVRFAYLTVIRSTLFEELQLPPYVKTVVVNAPSYCWALEYEEYKQILTTQAIQKYAFEHEVFWDLCACDECGHGHGHQEFINQHWNGIFPFSDEEMEEAFKAYTCNAIAARDLLHGHELRSTWRSVLNQLHRVESLRLIGPNMDCKDASSLPTPPECTIRPHDHGGSHPVEVCKRVAAPVGDALLAAFVASQPENTLEVKDLHFTCIMTDAFRWEALPGWRNLNLSQLRSLKLAMCVHILNRAGEGLWSANEKQEMADCSATTIASILHQCSGTLENLSIWDGPPLSWSKSKINTLSTLDFLCIGGRGEGNMEMSDLKAWLAVMASLKHLRLLGHLFDRDEWLELFAAIRNHKTPSYVRSNGVLPECLAEVRFDVWNGKVKGCPRQKGDDFPTNKIMRDLNLYLSGKTELDVALSS